MFFNVWTLLHKDEWFLQNTKSIPVEKHWFKPQFYQKYLQILILEIQTWGICINIKILHYIQIKNRIPQNFNFEKSHMTISCSNSRNNIKYLKLYVIFQLFVT